MTITFKRYRVVCFIGGILLGILFEATTAPILIRLGVICLMVFGVCIKDWKLEHRPST